jgi:hypothetical protein
MNTQKEHDMSREPGTRVIDTRDHGIRVVNGVEVRIQELVWNDTDGRSWDVYRVSDGQCLTMDHSFDDNPGDDEIAELLETPRDRYGYLHPDDYRASVDQMGGYSNMQPDQSDPRESAYMYKCPTHVVVDTLDGYVFKGDSSGELFDGPRAVVFAEARNMEQNPGFKSYEVFRLVPEVSVMPAVDDGKITYKWNCRWCGQEWPVRTTLQITNQNTQAAIIHPGQECQPDDRGGVPVPTDELQAWKAEVVTSQCDAFDCDDQHELAHKPSAHSVTFPVTVVDGE